MRSTCWQTGEVVFFARTPEFESIQGLRSPESDSFLEDFENEEIGVTLNIFYIDVRIMKREDFCFCSFIFLS